MALTAERDTKYRDGEFFEYPMAADTVIYAGAQTGLNTDGYLEPMSADPDLKKAGRAEQTVDNSGGAAGDKPCETRRGCFYYANSATDPVDLSSVGDTVYAEDDETVAKTDATSTLPAAGTLMDVDDYGVWLKI